jgi:ketosteroid isomerase-like protein
VAHAEIAVRLEQATNAQDVEAIVACFTEDYINETPAHPSRGFVGTEQVRRNWTTMFASVPDLRTRLMASHRAGDTVWSEWQMQGSRVDGVPHDLCGVIVFEMRGDQASRCRFYLEQVDQ